MQSVAEGFSPSFTINTVLLPPTDREVAYHQGTYDIQEQATGLGSAEKAASVGLCFNLRVVP